MGSGLRIDIQGTLGKYNYAHIPEELSNTLLGILTDHAHYTAVKKAPKKSGKLSRAIKKTVDIAKRVGFVFISTLEIPYALVAEFGSKHRFPHPYMRPAAAAARAKLKAIGRAAMKKAIEDEKARAT